MAERAPQTITLGRYVASYRAVHELKADGLLPLATKLRSRKYLNNLIKQDYRGVKQRIAAMLGFKGFRNAAITIAGIELMHRIRMGQFGLARLGVQGLAAPAIWNAALGAWRLYGEAGSVCSCRPFAPKSSEVAIIETSETRGRTRSLICWVTASGFSLKRWRAERQESRPHENSVGA
jgi:hypothetical protein